MSLNFKTNFEEFRESNLAGGAPPVHDKAVENFDSASQTRNLCLVWTDGRKKFFNYAYLISGEYQPEDGSIVLVFTSHTIVIRGFGLEELFGKLVQHLPYQITCSDPRYNETIETSQLIINEITVSKNE